MTRKSIERRCFEIERNYLLEGFVSGGWLYADVTNEVEINGKRGNYALLSQGTRFGITSLGYIDTATREFKKFEPQVNTAFDSTQSGGGGRKTKMYVPISQLSELKTLDEVLAIPGISIK